MTENKFGKYLIITNGEIVLVVIGVAIALRLKNWNDYKKNKHQRKKALLEIILDLRTNISVLKVSSN